MTELFAALVGSLITAVPLIIRLRQVTKAAPATIVARLDSHEDRIQRIEAQLSEQGKMLVHIHDMLHELEIYIGKHHATAIASEEPTVSSV